MLDGSSRGPGNERLVGSNPLVEQYRPLNTARCSSKVSISRIKTLNRGGYKLEQEIWMDVLPAGTRSVRQQFTGNGWRRLHQHPG
jgi:hypothetical protein